MKAILITGASSGIGEAFARRYAKLNENLVLVARSKEKLELLASELKRDNDISVTVICSDLSKTDAAKTIYDNVKERNIIITTLINNAGFATKGLFHETDIKKQNDEMIVNMLSLTELAYYFVKDMKSAGSGTIINIASAASFNPLPYGAVYAATKAYVFSLTNALYYEYKDSNIHFLSVCPGATDTHFFDDFAHMDGKLRNPDDVVTTTFKALKKRKMIAIDGFLPKLQFIMPRLLPLKLRLKITGSVGEKTWG